MLILCGNQFSVYGMSVQIGCGDFLPQQDVAFEESRDLFEIKKIKSRLKRNDEIKKYVLIRIAK
jgi:hypothetical protein